jgi:hypothetical protein
MNFIEKSSHFLLGSIQNGPSETGATLFILEPWWNPGTNSDMRFALLASTDDDGAETHNPLRGDGQG